MQNAELELRAPRAIRKLLQIPSRSRRPKSVLQDSLDETGPSENPLAGVLGVHHSDGMPTRAWFSTFIYCEPLQKAGLGRFNADLADECRRLRDYDAAGRRWSEKNYPGGYTSYASMNELHRFSSTFAGLEKKLARHVRLFTRALDMDLRKRTVRLTDLWVNIMPTATTHSLHLHPLSFVSGTYYVVTPPGCSGLKFEDPRLDRFMAAPPKIPKPRRENQVHVTYPAEAGNVILFESWLRHEVAANRVADERISISFNYNWS